MGGYVTGHQIYDVAIIGGGIIGMATSMALMNRFRLSLVLLEAEDRLAAHQTGNNSGVIHSGLYYKPGSLKARHCIAGREALYRFCREKNIRHEQCGKIVVATSRHELSMLDALKERGAGNGLKGITRLGPEEIREYEPHVCGIAGLSIPETGIVDYRRVTEAFADEVREKQGEILTGLRVVGSMRRTDGLVIGTDQGEVCSRHLINCGGLQSDRIARMCGVDPGLKIVPFRGEYYKLAPERRSLVKNLVYPVPDPAYPFLGVHFTRMIQGDVEAGPNAVLAFKREGYKKRSFSARDMADVLAYRGFWKLAFKYGKTGMGEFYRSFNRRAFLKALQRMIPELCLKDLLPGEAGVRAQALDPNGLLVDDFRIIQTESMIHVLNAPSPAATASISIGRSIAALAGKTFALQHRPISGDTQGSLKNNSLF
jgi:L-2-hydroxyglutarate oxidase